MKDPGEIVAKSVLFVVLTLAAGTDLRHRRIPNALILSGLSAFLFVTALAFFLPQTASLPQAISPQTILPPTTLTSKVIWMRGWKVLTSRLAAGGAGFFLHWLPYVLGGMGAGDVKLALVIGLLLGWAPWWTFVGSYCFVLACVLLWLFALGKRRPKRLPLAPSMTAAYYLYLLSPYFSSLLPLLFPR